MELSVPTSQGAAGQHRDAVSRSPELVPSAGAEWIAGTPT